MVTVPVLEEPFFGISFWLMRLERYCDSRFMCGVSGCGALISGVPNFPSMEYWGGTESVFTGVQRQLTGLLCSEGASISLGGPVHTTNAAVLVHLTQILTTDMVDLVAEECLVLKTPILWDNWLAGDINMSYGRGILFKLSERWPMIWRWSWVKEAITMDLWNILLQCSGRGLAQLWIY